MTDRSYKVYASRFILLGIGVVFLLGVFNLVVDPYDIFRLVTIPGINAKKIMSGKNMRMHKAYVVVRKQPQIIILGNSTAEAALVPEHPGFPVGPVYNLAIPGATMYEILKNFEHAHATCQLRMVLLSLDFGSFEIYPAKQQADFNEERLTTRAGSFSPWISLYKADLLSSLFSLEATKMSVATLKKQGETDDCLDNGMRDWNVLLRKMVQEKGIVRNFLDTEDFLARGIAALPVQKNTVGFQEDDYKYLQEIISTCYRDNIRLILFIPPNHVRRNVLIDLDSMGEILGAWKKKIVTMNEMLAQQAGKAPFPVWDFSGFSHYTNELLPRDVGTSEEMQWHWDSTHYKVALGDLVLTRIFSPQQQSSDTADRFGELLTSGNVETVLRRQAIALEEYSKNHPQDIAELVQIRKRYLSQQ